VPRPTWRASAFAAALAVVVYLNALNNPFVYDDRDTVVANPSLVDPSNIRFVLTHSPFRPVVNASYAIDRAVWGVRPFGFHLTNVLMHAVVVVLFYALLRCAVLDARTRREHQARPPQPLSRPEVWAVFTGAALFGVHPLMTEAVGYVSGRSELLCGMFFLAAVLCGRAAMLRSEDSRAARRPIWPSVGTFLFGALALLSKEVAVALPIVLLAYDRLLLPSTPEAKGRRFRLLFTPAIVVLGAAALVRLSVAAGPISAEKPFYNLLTQSIVIWRYLRLLILPIGQSIMHGVHVVTSAIDPLAWIAVGGLIALGLGAYLLRRRAPLVAFAIVWFLAIIAPSSSIVALREAMAEHRVYLASAGLFMAITAALAARGAERPPRPRPAVVFGFAVGAIIGVLGALTMARNEVWGSAVGLWREATVHAAGMWEPHYALGDALRESGDCAAAAAEYDAVARMRPNHRDAHTNLGICLAQLNRIDEAEAAFRRALQIDPSFVRGYTNLGALALVANQPERARDFYLRALEVDPRNVLARMQLARLYETIFRDFHSAARMCGEARALAPFTPGVVECVERNQRLAAGK
jgi:tetratricopeptide (TPR) repeat protein